MSTQLTEVVNKSRRGDRREELNRVPQVKSDIPLFFGTMGGEEFLIWQVKVDRFFDVKHVPENKQVKMVSIRLKSMASVWWDILVIQRNLERKRHVIMWRQMKQLMMKRFLPENYEQIPYKKYFECVQEKKTVTEYTNECVKQDLLKPNLKKEEVIVTEEALEEIDELAMLRILSGDFEEEENKVKISEAQYDLQLVNSSDLKSIEKEEIISDEARDNLQDF
ncbi:hypothetical protein QQ045_015838 [Rhodiola kirilowii]